MQAEKIKVLMADDNVLLCEIVSNYLRAQNDIELIDIAHDGIEACDKIQRLKPHVVILDCAMPMLDGIGVLEKLAQENLYRPVCIMLSGIRHDAVTKRAYDLGAEYYIIKPFDLDVLADRIRMFKSFTLASYKSDINIKSQVINSENDQIEVCTENLPDYTGIQTEYRQNPIKQYNQPVQKSQPTLSLEERVTNLLHEIGVPANIRGYRCLRTAIIITVKNLDLLHFVTKELYPSIARELNTTPSSVERAIRHAIGLVWEHGNIAALDRLFGYSIETRKKRPSNSEFIALIADKFRIENKAS
ncbi:MAG: sporulation transcription factor Spo0A [Clostridiales bacterium]|nr:sporulation transcription factor Spo0A [Clostridiales bacterium]